MGQRLSGGLGEVLWSSGIPGTKIRRRRACGECGNPARWLPWFGSRARRARRISKQAGGRWGNRRSPLAGRDSPAAVVPAVPGLRHSPSGLGSLRIEGTALRPTPTAVCHGARARRDGVLAMLGASASMGVGRCWKARAPARGSARHLDTRSAPWRGRFVGDGRERSAGGSELELARSVPTEWVLACFEGVGFG